MRTPSLPPRGSPGGLQDLSCFCPLYHRDRDGNRAIYAGGKGCSACTCPREPDNYDAIRARLK